MGVADYSKRRLIKNCEVPHLKSTDLNRSCNIQVKQHYCIMLASGYQGCGVGVEESEGFST